MLKKINLLILSFLFFLSLFACVNNKRETILKQVGICDTINTSYKQIIVPILTTQCNSQNLCHGANPGSISLETYQAVKDNSTSILERIKRQPGDGGFMPKDNQKVSDCDINKIQTWVNRGALEN